MPLVTTTEAGVPIQGPSATLIYDDWYPALRTDTLRKGKLATAMLLGIPLVYVIIAVILLVFAVGYAAMSRHVANSGAFYTYVSKGLGQIMIEPLKGEVPEFRDVPYIVLSTSRATLEAKRPLIKAAVRAYTRAIKFVAEHPEAARKLVRPYFTDMSADDAVFNAAFDKYVHGTPTSPLITPEQVQKTADLLSISKKQKVSVNYTDVVYPDLAREADHDILGH